MKTYYKIELDAETIIIPESQELREAAEAGHVKKATDQEIREARAQDCMRAFASQASGLGNGGRKVYIIENAQFVKLVESFTKFFNGDQKKAIRAARGR